jgi:hypothetical protein
VTDIQARRRAAHCLSRLRPSLAVDAEKCVGRAEAVAFLARLDAWSPVDRTPLVEEHSGWFPHDHPRQCSAGRRRTSQDCS